MGRAKTDLAAAGLAFERAPAVLVERWVAGNVVMCERGGGLAADALAGRKLGDGGEVSR